MASVVGELIPLGVGVAISPIPIIATVLMLFSPRSKITSTLFLAGWVVGIVGVSVLVGFVSGAFEQSDPSSAKPVMGVLQILLGLALLYLAWRQWNTRSPSDEAAGMPPWLQTISSISGMKAFGLGLLLSSVNPKNLGMGISAGITLGSPGVGLAPAMLGLLVYLLLGSSTVLLPVLGNLVAHEQLASPLETLKQWLVQNNGAIMATLFVILGSVMVSKGINHF